MKRLSISPLSTILILLTTMLCGVSCRTSQPDAKAAQVTSPDGRIKVGFTTTALGEPRYIVTLEGKSVLLESRLGLMRDDADFTQKLKLTSVSRTKSVQDDYELLTIKRRNNHYRANQKVFHLQTAAGQKLDVIFQISNDGVAFRYRFPETDSSLRRLSEEVSSFHFSSDTKAWLQPIAVAHSGWSQANPSYEEYYEKEIPVGTPSKFGAGWIFPALFRSDETWVLISETGLGRNYCGCRLRSKSPGGEYSIGFADPREVIKNGAANPESTLPWITPWRIIAMGNLKTIIESTLGTDLADPAKAIGQKVEPGKAAWSWPLMGDDQTTFPVQKRFIDYAAEMGWRYCLVDGLWDKQIGYVKLKELVDYGRTKNVKILVWYNSAGDWNTTPQTPRDLMLTHESRIKEFDRLKEIGIAGLKVDFFGGDGQSMIGYYHDILEDTARYGFAMNFHGATLLRGWERTYPHLMTMEAIRGLEFCTFEQANADQEPSHAAMIPFTRNIFDPMDFTPMVLDQIPRIQRRTTSGFELALSVLFTSGIQHYAEIPEGMAKAPDYVRSFIRGIPSIWDDVKFIDGYPGKFAVIARQRGGTWYVAGINGEAQPRELEIDLSQFGDGGGSLITDGEEGNLSFRKENIPGTGAMKKVKISLKPNGGFVLTIGNSSAERVKN